MFTEIGSHLIHFSSFIMCFATSSELHELSYCVDYLIRVRVLDPSLSKGIGQGVVNHEKPLRENMVMPVGHEAS